MFQRIAKMSLFAASVFLFAGCIESTQIITLNPDGKGKVTYEVLVASAGALDPMGGAPPGGGGKEKTLDEIRKMEGVNLLTKTAGVTAWKDVSVRWSPDGRLHILGTAYFDRLEDLAAGGGMAAPGPGPGGGTMLAILKFQVERDMDSLKITAKKDDPAALPKQPAVDVAKMTDKELDENILKARIALQAMKPLLVMVYTDMKAKTVFRLPGEVQVSKGFKMEQDGLVHVVDGNEVLKGFKKFLALDDASMKKLMKSGNPNVMETFGLSEEIMEPSLTVHKVGKPLFDYDREVQVARDAYPQLRQLFNVPADMKLPGEK